MKTAGKASHAGTQHICCTTTTVTQTMLGSSMDGMPASNMEGKQNYRHKIVRRASEMSCIVFCTLSAAPGNKTSDSARHL